MERTDVKNNHTEEYSTGPVSYTHLEFYHCACRTDPASCRGSFTYSGGYL